MTPSTASFVAKFVFYVHWTNCLTLWNRVFLEKLIVDQLVKTFPAFYETRSFITVLTRARH
jgi:hypothetical protein